MKNTTKKVAGKKVAGKKVTAVSKAPGKGKVNGKNPRKAC